MFRTMFFFHFVVVVCYSLEYKLWPLCVTGQFIASLSDRSDIIEQKSKNVFNVVSVVVGGGARKSTLCIPSALSTHMVN